MNKLKLRLENIYNKYVHLCQDYTKKSSKKIPEIGVNEGHYLEILSYLDKPTFSDFAKEAEISRPAATQIIRKFIDKGFVEKIQSESDKRVFYLKVKDNFKTYFSEIAKAEESLFNKMFSILNKDELNSLENILNKLDKNL